MDLFQMNNVNCINEIDHESAESLGTLIKVIFKCHQLNKEY